MLLRRLDPVAEAVGVRMTVLIDSGFRPGADGAKALAFGTEGVMIGMVWRLRANPAL